jgi:NADPH:quinone reductase-like Zn-dependent oxidoreductase
MKAIILKGFGGIAHFELREVDRPNVGNDELLVKIRATAFNPIDYQMRQGASESRLLKSPILGREFSGEIIETGKHVTAFDIGDKIAAYVGSMASNGTYAEFISVPAALVAKTPSKISFEQAAAIPLVGLTAWQCFSRVVIPTYEPIFIAGGAGGVGTILIKLLLANGNSNIYTTAGNAESIHHLENIGVVKNNIIDYNKEDVVAWLRSKNKLFKYAFDLVGNKMSEVCAELLDVFGTYFDVTFRATPKARELLFGKAATIANIANYASALRQETGKLAYYGNTLNELFEKINSNIISPAEINIVGNLSVETVQKAHLLMENNETKGKKLVMTME